MSPRHIIGPGRNPYKRPEYWNCLICGEESASSHFLQCPNGKMNLVFPDSNGNPMDADNMIHRFFKPMLVKAKIDSIRFHDLRHTYASLLISKNVPIKYIQSQLGHSSIQVTMDRYGHLMQEVHDLGVSALVEIENDLIEKNKKKNKKIKAVKQAI